MELHEIRYFLALSETLNFTRAAEACNVTQPALTRAIRSLEDKLGGPLVHRERSNTHLTELGRLMKPFFEEMRDQLNEARRRAEDFVKLNDARLAIGLMCTIGPAKLVDLFRGFSAEFQGVELFLKDGGAGALESQLSEGAIDVAIYCSPEAPSEALHSLPLYSEPFVLAAAPCHPLARLDRVRLRDLDGHRYLWRTNCEYADRMDLAFAEQGVKVEFPYGSERDDWIQCMVLAGLGFTILPQFAVTVSGLVTRPLVEPEFTRHVKLVTVRGRPHSPALGAFVHAARRYPWTERLRAAARAHALS